MFNFKPNSLTHRVAIGKFLGAGIGLIGVAFMFTSVPEATWQLYLGVLFWYAMVGAFIGLSGVYSKHPTINIPFSWPIRGALIGGWMNFLVLLFAWDFFNGVLVSYFGAGSIWSSPWWGVVEGMVVGAVMDYIMTKRAGEGFKLVEAEA